MLVALRFGFENPWWAAISAWMVSNQDLAALWSKGAQRIAGTMAGLAIGLAFVILAAGMPALQLALLFGVGAVGARQHFASPHGYGWFYGALTALMMLIEGATAPGGLVTFAGWRAAEIVTGVAAATLVNAVFVPALVFAPPKPPADPPGEAELRRLALTGGLVPVLMVLAWQAFDLPAVLQLCVTATVLVDRNLVDLRTKGRQRILGCLAGALYALGVLALGLPTLPLWIGTLGIGMLLFSTLHHGGGRSAYVGTQAGIAVITALVSSLGPPEALLPVLNRLAGITLGVMVMLFAARVAAAAGAARPAPA